MGVYSNLAAQTVRGESTNNMNAMLNLMVEATAADTNMFNSIIELDFQEAAANKDGGSYITEAEEGAKATKKSIIDKIKAFLSKVWTAIKTAFESFFVKVSETFGNDKKFAEKYKYDDIAKDFKKKMEKCDMEVTIPDKDVIDKTKEMIVNVAREVEQGKIYSVKVLKVEEFGCVIELWPGCEGFVHISQLDTARVNKCEDVVSVGDTILVKD